VWISVLNLNLETPDLKPPKKTECFQFLVNLFLSNCWFYYLVLYKPQQRNLEFWTYFSVISFLCSAAKEGFQTQLFKTRVLTQPDFENPKRKSFQTWKRPYLVAFVIKEGEPGIFGLHQILIHRNFQKFII